MQHNISDTIIKRMNYSAYIMEPPPEKKTKVEEEKKNEKKIEPPPLRRSARLRANAIISDADVKEFAII